MTTEIHIDPQAFLCGQPEVVARVRGEIVQLMERLEQLIPGVTDAMLFRIDAIPYQGDDNTYIETADQTLKAAADELRAHVQEIIRHKLMGMQTSGSMH
jgi:hypothetical protein